MARRRATGHAEGAFAAGQEHAKVPARALLTVGEADWGAPLRPGEQWDVRGAILRLKPPRRATREEVQAERERLLQAGAAAVRVVARVPEAVVVNIDNELAPGQGAREVVEQMAEEANTKDRDALRGALERAMARGGL